MGRGHYHSGKKKLGPCSASLGLTALRLLTGTINTAKEYGYGFKGVSANVHNAKRRYIILAAVSFCMVSTMLRARRATRHGRPHRQVDNILPYSYGFALLVRISMQLAFLS